MKIESTNNIVVIVDSNLDDANYVLSIIDDLSFKK